jgi:hypothetical protein
MGRWRNRRLSCSYSHFDMVNGKGALGVLYVNDDIWDKGIVIDHKALELVTNPTSHLLFSFSDKFLTLG